MIRGLFTFRLLLYGVVAFAVTIASLTTPATAHQAGQLPYFKVNGAYPDLYFIQNSLVTKLDVPQTVQKQHYLVGETIHFQIEKNIIEAPKDLIEKSEFIIDYGDGNKTAGLETSHEYTDPGSYIVNVYAEAEGESVLIESCLIHVLPEEGYVLPDAVIALNGKTISDMTGTYPATPGSQVILSAAGSKAGSAPIKKYLWDFADGTTGNQAIASHTYGKDAGIMAPVVRVYDENGFFDDAYVDIQFDAGQTKKVADKEDAYTSMVNGLKKNLGRTFEGGSTNYMLAGLVLAVAALAGSMHSLTPGHGKSVMAALLIGRKRSKWTDVVIVAAAITLTHTIVIYGMGFALLVLDLKFSITSTVAYLEKVSAVLILMLAGFLIYGGYRKWRHRQHHLHGHAHSHEHHHGHAEGGHHHPEAKDFSRADSKWGLFMAGAAGGIIPCIDALALLLLAVGLGYVGFGLLLVFSFSLGLAAAIIIIGLLLLSGRDRIKKDGKLAIFADVYAPMVSGVIILLVALVLLFKPMAG